MTDELTPEAKAEIQAAIRTLRSDGIHIHRTYPEFLKSQKPTEEAPPTEGEPPPVKDPASEEKPKPKRGLGLWARE